MDACAPFLFFFASIPQKLAAAKVSSHRRYLGTWYIMVQDQGHIPCPPLKSPPQCCDSHKVTPPQGEGGGGLHHTAVALKLQQLKYNLKKSFFGCFSA